MRILVVGGGGREHALAWALARDPGVTEVHAAPGNPGIAEVATLHEVDPMDAEAVAALAERLEVDLVVVGPEAPLVAGVATGVRARDIVGYCALWMLVGGLCYTIGAVVLVYDYLHHHLHAVWHLLVIAGSTCHFFGVWTFIVAMAA